MLIDGMELPEGEFEGARFLHNLACTLGYLSDKYYRRYVPESRGTYGTNTCSMVGYDTSIVIVGMGSDALRVKRGVEVEYGVTPCGCDLGKVEAARQALLPIAHKVVREAEKAVDALDSIGEEQ